MNGGHEAKPTKPKRFGIGKTKMITSLASLSLAERIAHGIVSITHYEVRDKVTGRTVATAKDRATANRIADRRDNAHGGYRFRVEAVYG